ncbi:hemolysin family protein [Mesobacillus maritimus]|uniref:hemolysin family protein n=1 Tax=Mesobacillus maritimus TaxID=1643336 RepID=UPI00203A3D25|nr:hemolysin family protein [Mesobacillus maritimus]MCM3585609.1 hemolysin family protein [Mesobacillus maritimus]MCM3669081.1 hemolysin family protein [Mesobacillus maritimus]
MGIEIIILVILILLNAFFAASEMALVSINDNKIKVMAESGDKRAIMVHQLLSEPSRFLATIQIGITLAGFLASAFAAGSFAAVVADYFYDLGVPLTPYLLETISTVLITLILSYFTLVFGELVPKRLALQKAEAVSFFAVTPLTWLSKVTYPFVKLLTLSTNLLVKLFGLDPNADDGEVTEEEIRMMVDVGQEKGAIQEAEKQMINNIFEFDNKTVSEIMTHRTNIVAIPVDSNLKDTVHTVNVEKYTRIPVFEEDLDHIVGIFHVKDLIQFLESGDQEAFDLRGLLREPYYVLKSIPIDHLFRDMQKNNVQLAVAIDEYGGTEGIVTIEDLIEEIVGNIFDEYDDPELDQNEIEEIDQYNYVMAGITNLYEVEDVLNIELPTQDYDTLSGFIIGQLGYIPAIDDRPAIEYQDVIFTVEEMNDRRIVKVKVSMKEPVKQDILSS